MQDLARRMGDCYTVVRFGNVLGSRGSVVPHFQRQIAEGGPLTVTHPEMKRYFMTIPEAVQLVLQASTLAEGGETFVLEMGEQVLIMELAEELIRLSGLKLGRDIDIVITQPRPGEKLSEELFGKGEEPHPTEHEKILVASGNSCLKGHTLTRHLEELETLTQEGDPAPIIAKLQEIVPSYQP